MVFSWMAGSSPAMTLQSRGQAGATNSSYRHKSQIVVRLCAEPPRVLFRGNSRAAARGVAVAARDLSAHFGEGLVVVAELNRRHASGIAGV